MACGCGSELPSASWSSGSLVLPGPSHVCVCVGGGCPPFPFPLSFFSQSRSHARTAHRALSTPGGGLPHPQVQGLSWWHLQCPNTYLRTCPRFACLSSLRWRRPACASAEPGAALPTVCTWVLENNPDTDHGPRSPHRWGCSGSPELPETSALRESRVEGSREDGLMHRG